MPDMPLVQVRRASPDDWPGILQLRQLSYPNGLDPDELQRRFFLNPRFRFEHDVWVAQLDGMIAANLVAMPFETYLPGGRLAPSRGIASVAVHPLCRRRGVAGALLRGVLSALRDEEVRLATLFPFEYAFYARYGWAGIGQSIRYRLPPDFLPAFGERGNVRVLTPEDLDGLSTCREEHFRRQGSFATRRQLSFWQQQWFNRDWQGFGYPAEGPLEGYALFGFAAVPDAPYRQDLVIDDWVAGSGAALRGLVGALSLMQEQVRYIRVTQPSRSPFAPFWLEQRVPDSPKMGGGDAPLGEAAASWMGRILHLPLALAERRYAEQNGTLGIRCLDHDLSANARTFTLQVEQGYATLLERDLPETCIETDIGTLTQIWAGAVTASDAQAWGRLRASDEAALGLANRLFQTENEPFLPEVDSF